jgi:uncharacterized protein (DUF2141 family)
MRNALLAMFVLGASFLVTAQSPTPSCTLTIVVEGMDSAVGNLGILVFNNPKGWPDDRTVAFRDTLIPAQQGTQTAKVADLPAGRYAVALIHDVNKNHKIDKNWIGQPKEQWGMSNNLHATIKAPSIDKAWFQVQGNTEIHIKLNNP